MPPHLPIFGRLQRRKHPTGKFSTCCKGGNATHVRFAQTVIFNGGQFSPRSSRLMVLDVFVFRIGNVRPFLILPALLIDNSLRIPSRYYIIMDFACRHHRAKISFFQLPPDADAGWHEYYYAWPYLEQKSHAIWNSCDMYTAENWIADMQGELCAWIFLTLEVSLGPNAKRKWRN